MNEDPVAQAVAEGALDGKRACSKKTLKGKPCKGMAVHGSSPPICASHLKRTGRKPPKIDGDAPKQLLELLRAGNLVSGACVAAGIPERTYYEWMQKGREGIEPYAELALKVAEAMAEGDTELVEAIKRGSDKDWRAAAWLLERRNPDDWSKPTAAATPKPPRRPDGEEAEQPQPQVKQDPFAEMEADLRRIEAAAGEQS